MSRIIKQYLFALIAFFFVAMAIHGIEEVVKRPENVKSAQELQTMINQYEEQKQKAIKEKEQLKVTDPEYQEKEEDIARAEYGIERAKSVEIARFTDAAQQRARSENMDFADYRTQTEANLNKLAETFTKMVQEAGNKLQTAVQVAKTYQGTQRDLETLSNHLPNLFFSKPIEKGAAYDQYLKNVSNLKKVIIASVDTKILENESAKRSPEQKFEAFDPIINELNGIKDAIAQELEQAKDDQQYQTTLLSLRDVAEQALVQVEQTAVKKAVTEQAPWWVKILSTIKNIFKPVREFFEKTTIPEPTVADKVIVQIKTAGKPLGYVDNLDKTIDSLSNQTQDLITRAQNEKKNHGTVSLDTQSRLQELRSTLRNVERSFSQQDQAIVIDAYDEIQRITGDITAYMNRYKQNANTLFDKLLDDYNGLFGGTGFGVHQLYEALGLKQTALPEEIAAARSIKTALPVSTGPGKAARNAGYLLTNPVSKQTYDAFLTDYNTLIKNNVDPMTKDKTTDMQLLQQTNNLEISQDLYNRFRNEVLDTLEPVFTRAGILKQQVGVSGSAEVLQTEFPPLFTRIGDMVGQIDTVIGPFKE